VLPFWSTEPQTRGKIAGKFIDDSKEIYSSISRKIIHKNYLVMEIAEAAQEVAGGLN
jgi:hypothetical protein